MNESGQFDAANEQEHLFFTIFVAAKSLAHVDISFDDFSNEFNEFLTQLQENYNESA